MFQVALFEPEIPPNAGNIIRLCANAGACLHFIKPLGFELDDRALKRAGLDYHEYADISTHDDYATFTAAVNIDRLFAFSTHGRRSLYEVKFRPGDTLLFGPETRGLPRKIKEGFAPERLLRIPMTEQSRSLNLSNAVAIAVYEAWRQQCFA